MTKKYVDIAGKAENVTGVEQAKKPNYIDLKGIGRIIIRSAQKDVAKNDKS